MRMQLPLILPLALLAVACQSPQQSQPAQEEERGVEIPLAPRPYTAEQIRAAHPVGTYTLYRLESKGQPPLLRRTLWTQVDAEGCEMDNRDWPEADPAAVEETHGSATWAELEGHASFPAPWTELSETQLEVGAGRFDCWLYDMSEPAEDDADGLPAHNLFWFAKGSPGSPVRYAVLSGDERIFDMQLLETNRRSN